MKTTILLKPFKVHIRSILSLFATSLLIASCNPGLENDDDTIKEDILEESLGASRLQTFNEGPKQGGVKERLGQRGNHNDMQPTGFHVDPYDTLKLEATQISGNRMPKVAVGTPFRDNIRPVRTYYQLDEGENIFVADEYGGMVYIQFITNESETTYSKAEVEFKDGFKKVPYYIKDETTKQEWLLMLETFNDVRDVMFVTDYTMLTVGLEDAIQYKDENQELMCNYLDKIIKTEGQISGLDASSAIHENRDYKFLLTVRDPEAGGYMAASIALYFTQGIIDRILIPEKLGGTDGWGIWHEAGHVHQQEAWTWSEVVESTVNIYALAVERAFGVTPSRVTKNNEWPSVEAFLALPDSQRNFNSDLASNGVRMALFHQLWLAFGDEFYIQMHKETREEQPEVENTNDRMRYFILKSCTISGKDLTNFFKKWGLPVSSNVYDEISNLNLPTPEEDLTLLRDN